MDTSQKRERDRKQRQRRQEKEDKRKERSAQKLLRRTTSAPGSPAAGLPVPEVNGVPAPAAPRDLKSSPSVPGQPSSGPAPFSQRAKGRAPKADPGRNPAVPG